jgi:2-keto-4-pentenoate hydratase/2-oxohepta-3-ene-1,7-dioic acid hydratase in catechol pathway
VWIGKSGKNIEKSDALKHVGGYFIGIDFTDRGKIKFLYRFSANC